MDEVIQLGQGRQARFVEVVTLLLAIWLAVSPFVLGFNRGTAADVVDLGIGVIVAVVAYHQLRQRLRRPGWSFFCAVLGLLEMVSPWAFAYAGEPFAVWQAEVFGGLIAVFAFWGGCSLSDWRDWRGRPRSHRRLART